jgi:hypothetical protein
MPRARNLKPSFFLNEDIAKCAPLARLLFQGLWTLADKDGRLEDRVPRIRAAILPYDEDHVDAWLNELHAAGFIQRYQTERGRYIQINCWQKHGRPHPDERSEGYPPPLVKKIFVSKEAVKFCLPLEGSHSSSWKLESATSNPPNPPSGGSAASPLSAEPTLKPEDFLQAWQAIPGFSSCRGFTRKRLRTFRARAKDPSWAAAWREALSKAARTPFCLGRNERGWKATVDWFLRPDTVTRILEGVYDNCGSHGPPPRRPESAEERKARIARERAEREAAARNTLPLSQLPRIKSQLT